MSSLLAKIQVHAGMEPEFENVMAYMYRQTHGTETGVLRYEYWRGRDPGYYYCLLSFEDNLAFWRHQASDHHEGQMEKFQACIAALDLEIIDPVQGACALPPTHEQQVPDSEPGAVREQAHQFPINPAHWWLALRNGMASGGD